MSIGFQCIYGGEVQANINCVYCEVGVLYVNSYPERLIQRFQGSLFGTCAIVCIHGLTSIHSTESNNREIYKIHLCLFFVTFALFFFLDRKRGSFIRNSDLQFKLAFGHGHCLGNIRVPIFYSFFLFFFYLVHLPCCGNEIKSFNLNFD